MNRIATVAIIAAALLASRSASACSVTSDYRVPTNLELAGKAELILLAKVTGGVESEDPFASTVTLSPIETLKGEMPDGDIEVAGLSLAEGEARGFGVLSNPYEFEGAHPVSYIGACIRYIFPRGTTALFFLEQGEVGWAPSGDPFSRWAEDVPGPDAPWVQLTALYVHAAAMPEDLRREMLEEQREALLARVDEPVAQLMAADIARQLEGPNDTWNSRMDRALGLSEPEAEAGSEMEQADEMEDDMSAVEAALDAMRADQGR